jgi:predicted HicB family RNase H-like nuclease
MRKKFTTTLDEELIKQVKIYAIEHDTSVAKLIEKAIRQEIEPK